MDLTPSITLPSCFATEHDITTVLTNGLNLPFFSIARDKINMEEWRSHIKKCEIKDADSFYDSVMCLSRQIGHDSKKDSRVKTTLSLEVIEGNKVVFTLYPTTDKSVLVKDHKGEISLVSNM